MEDTQYQRLLSAALNFLSIRLRSKKEIQEFLRRKVIKWNIAVLYGERVLNRLDELGYINDDTFALAFITSRNRFHPKGKLILRQELEQKGINPDVIEKALRDAGEDESGNQVEIARRAARKKLRGYARYPKKERRNKVYNYLQRKGFDHTTISSVIDEILSEALQYDSKRG